ncbi:Uu.00g129910.m01.CDS01 [Anthostomella pinea]|uniref:Uu.00g129910.m01.CDS01 n=1 Tax=Anthostomella pinea TaxID=933095 RepID=A0AAI8YI89_9PEZI|nr:Uu.00g129910.m01.CDS01 [Anthostomella pinea]
MEPQRLLVWGHSAPRSYIRQIFCFPFVDGKSNDAYTHLRTSLRKIALQYPYLTEHLRLKDDHQANVVYYSPNVDTRTHRQSIPFETLDAMDSFPWTYHQLKREEFTPRAFYGDLFCPADAITHEGKPVPVLQLRAVHITGGLLLSIFLHHCIADGDCSRLVLEAIAAHTRGNRAAKLHTELKLNIPCPPTAALAQIRQAKSRSMDEIVNTCPGYAVLPAGNAAPRYMPRNREGKIFVIRLEKLKQLQKSLRDADSSNTAPSTHVANYFGYGVTYAIAVAPQAKLKTAHEFPEAEGLRNLASTISAAFKDIDEEFVSTRTAMLEACPDLKRVGVMIDAGPWDPHHYHYNTWRFFGADAEWDVPGFLSSKPDAIRRGQSDWTFGAASVMLARKEADGEAKGTIDRM